MYKGSIFERLTGGLHTSDGTSESVLYKSVANNLSNIFSTNAGSSQTVIDYGRPDLNNSSMSMKESLESIEMSSEICIKKYEPRLYKTRISISKNQLDVNHMNVEIEGYLHIDGRSQKIHYRADLLSNGSVKVYKSDD